MILVYTGVYALFVFVIASLSIRVILKANKDRHDYEESCSGKIISYRTSNASRALEENIKPSYLYTITYKTVDGQDVIAEYNHAVSELLPAGTEVTVYYNVSNPNKIYMENPTAKRNFVMFIIYVVALFAILGLLPFVDLYSKYVGR